VADGVRILGIDETAQALGISPDTVRRHIKEGKLSAKKVQTKRGPRWKVTLPPSQTVNSSISSQTDISDIYVNSLLERIKSLETELTARRSEVQQLYGMLGQKALPAPAPAPVSWLKRLFK